MYELCQLSGQLYVNEYAPKKNADTAAVGDAALAVVRTTPAGKATTSLPAATLTSALTSPSAAVA